ncbi:MAG: phosphatidate cytidylyltransferase [Planctomycetes bacterium]|nr:phosphatidate cytidylyltransferase [Planctomycetota bacterium]
MSSGGSALKARLVGGVAVIASLAAIAWLDIAVLPGIPVALVLGGMSALGVHEFAALAARARWPVWRGALFVATALVFAAPLGWLGPQLGALGGIGPLALGLVIATLLVAVLRGDVELGFERSVFTAAGFLYIPAAMATLLYLRLADGGGAAGLERLLWLACVSKSGDICGYFVGRAIGRTKAIPRISPGKTVEGCTASLVGAVLVGCGLGAGLGWLPGLGLPTLVGAGIITNLAAQLGDLTESLLKRRVGAKDASALLPGFGGVLDMIDSMLVAGPVFFAFWILVS